MSVTIHETAISLLQRSYPGAQKSGFRKAIQKLQWRVEGWEDSEAPASWNEFLRVGEVWTNGIIPDLWFLDEDVMSVVCIEVEDSNQINNRKFEIYKDLWWHLDDLYWELHLLVSDRWCNLTPVPVHRYTSMGTVELEGHRLSEVISAEREKNEIMFELSNIYCITDSLARGEARAKWMETYPSFTYTEFKKNRSEQAIYGR